MGLIQKNVSEEMVVANRKNAQKSTGPRTKQGKRSSRLNAAKHLVWVQVLGASMKELSEDPTELEKLREDLQRAFDPQDPFEEILINDMAQIRWRPQRLMRAEAGIVASHGTELEINRKLDYLSDRGVEALSAPLTHSDSVASRPGSYYACGEILGTLVALKKSIQAEGFQEEHRKSLEQIYGLGVTDEGRRLLSLFEEWTDDEEDGESPDEAGLEREFLQRLDSEIEDYKKLAELYRVRDIEITQTREDAQLLPSKEDLDKVIRYEASLERQFERKLQQLVAWRRAKGDGIRPPADPQDSTGNRS